MSQHLFNCKRHVIAVSVAAVLAVAASPQGKAQIWDNSSGDYSWDTATNWDNNVVPTQTQTAVFNGAAAGSPISFSAITLGAAAPATTGAGAITFGAAGTATGSSGLAAYTLGSGAGSTINVNISSTNANVFSYLGTANTATQTINSNVFLNASTPNTGFTGWNYVINNQSSGKLVFTGDFSNKSSQSAVANEAGNPLTTGGNYAQRALLKLGNNAGIAYGDVEFRGNAYTSYGNSVDPLVIANSRGTMWGQRFQVNGTKGSLIFNNATGVNLFGGQQSNGNYPIELVTGRSGQDKPHVVFAAGNNIVQSSGNTQGGGGVTVGSAVDGANFYVKVDSGATVAIGSLTTTNGTTTANNQTFNLYGAGTGVVYYTPVSSKAVGAATKLNVVKDGTGSWAFTGGAVPAGNFAAYSGTTTIRNGTFLVMGTGSNGTGTLLVDPLNSADSGAAPILGGKGTISGAVTVNSGGTITAGGAATGGAETYATVTSPTGNIGKLTLLSTLTAQSGAKFLFDLDSNTDFTLSAGLGNSDNLAVTGTLALNNASLFLNDLGNTLLMESGPSDQKYFNLISYSGGISGTFNNLADGDTVSVGLNQYTISYSSNEVNLNLIAVPEPSTWAMFLGGAGLLLVLRKLRREKKSEVI